MTQPKDQAETVWERRLSGKVAFITGGGSGIGKASAILMARHGAKVGIVGRTMDELKEVQAEIESSGGQALPLVADISVPEEIEKAIVQTAEKWGRLDIVFANAGINGVLTPIEDMQVSDWETVININLKGTFLTVKYAVPYLKKNGGSVIITSSINGNRVFSNFGFSAYSTSKAGQVAFMKMAAIELAQFKIRVNAICPGAIETNIGENTKQTPELEEIRIPVEFPEGSQPLEDGPGSAMQVAQLALFLGSDESSHITGTDIYIDGAESLLRG
ncbi:NAD(P)-dependent dehydrogenase, short-chain alcohol dehydrogenase family [Paenibacillus sp. UNCCL117]|uniref:SDR family oxidoreductase n=1 Tax=unclassified Paenibacillus TaxID=185978 RepID=UPI00088D489A|nr:MULTISPECIES: SDR family NAD(P)-dependent oxidoreductase [unclassified Paenibacillus]SDE12226.1 NAD(P)-dependent dehydrogenase, short-chain alcohol dehydrogenase family [Paenibacillus sp. cl123]SFW60137.1 NAD(P)-dependent dehydrogenase, short-chain alcohol dehydrogenase family [Paenibacillus sp. UNCCL117]